MPFRRSRDAAFGAGSGTSASGGAKVGGASPDMAAAYRATVSFSRRRPRRGRCALAWRHGNATPTDGWLGASMVNHDMDLEKVLIGEDGTIPRARYTSAEFAELEFERLWSRVWQVACREEEVAEVGAFCEYLIGDQSILVVPLGPRHHPGLPQHVSAPGHASGRRDGQIRRRLHPVPLSRLALRPRRQADRGRRPGRVRSDPTWTPGSRPFRSTGGAASSGSASIPARHRCSTTSTPCRPCLAPYHLDQLRIRTYLSTVLPANWKVAVDAFNEGYHVQGTHPQLLPWTDDVSLEYEPLGIHAHYGRLPNSRRQLRPSPRLGLSEGEYDEGEILENFVRGLGGLFYRDERALVEEIRATPARRRDHAEPLSERPA